MILYETDEVVCIATMKSVNEKTGNMVQTWFLNKNLSPVEAVKSGDDIKVCFDCKHRLGSCYVNVGQAPLNVWKSYKAGNYTAAKPRDFLGRVVRFGSYGEPVLLPIKYIAQILKYASGHTGYTHQWRTCDQIYKQYFQASVDSLEEYKLAKSTGWKTFRVTTDLSDIQLGENVCPSFTGITCEQCTKCDGKTGDIVIQVHGTNAKINKFKNINITLSGNTK